MNTYFTSIGQKRFKFMKCLKPNHSMELFAINKTHLRRAGQFSGLCKNEFVVHNFFDFDPYKKTI